jgi:UDP-N-acetylmuramoyl-tripeptide--D-alanyl-D-alanine ligase
MNASAARIEPALLAREVGSFVIDSRDVKAGDVFFALSQPDYRNNGFNGEFEDGTGFVVSAIENGALACVVRHDRYTERITELEKYTDRIVLVDDVIAALQGLARSVYHEWNRPVVAITGSAGKTTAKELTAHVLRSSGRKILKNIKNYNNGLGHPLTVLNLVKDSTYDVAVLEMGMSTPMHEIARLCSITPPDVAVELNVLPVHVEHLGSIENVAKAKAELIEGMKEGGTAVLNADDPRVLEMGRSSRGDVVTFGIDSPADVMAAKILVVGLGKTTFDLITPTGSSSVTFHLDGRHNIMNALAAAAVGHTFGLDASAIAGSLSQVSAPPQRGEVLRFQAGFIVINDSYNSNPDALMSMVRTLMESSPEGGRRIVVAGEMLELGDDAAELHRQTGVKVAEAKVDQLIGVRGLAAEMVAGANSAGLANAKFAEDSDLAGEMLAAIVSEGDVVLVKGSRGVRTERVIERLLADFEIEKGSGVGSGG